MYNNKFLTLNWVEFIFSMSFRRQTKPIFSYFCVLETGYESWARDVSWFPSRISQHLICSNSLCAALEVFVHFLPIFKLLDWIKQMSSISESGKTFSSMESIDKREDLDEEWRL